MSLAGVKKKRKKCYQIWFWRLLAFVTDFSIVLAINRMSGLLSKQCSKNRVCVCFSHFCSNYSSWSRSAVTASAKATVRKSLQLNFFHFQSPKPILSVRKDGFTFVEGRHFFSRLKRSHQEPLFLSSILVVVKIWIYMPIYHWSHFQLILRKIVAATID
jgi:hypothetical protein